MMSFRTRLTSFFVLIVVVPMAAVGFLVFRLIDDSQSGKADARASAVAGTAASVYANASTQASRQAMPGLLPQFPVSVSGSSATRKPVAWNTELLSTGATPREATGGFAVRGCLQPCGR